ncbi:MAG: hypothetical protein GYA62_10860, partial [Bacteroidales bacterium]|nr:hypothetical protein [Bacteroidales bacterium]
MIKETISEIIIKLIDNLFNPDTSRDIHKITEKLLDIGNVNQDKQLTREDCLINGETIITYFIKKWPNKIENEDAILKVFEKMIEYCKFMMNYYNSDLETPLILIVKNNNTILLNLIGNYIDSIQNDEKYKIDFNHLDNSGNSFLHYIVKSDNVEINNKIEEYLKYYQDLKFLENFNIKTPSFYKIKEHLNYRKEIIELIKNSKITDDEIIKRINFVNFIDGNGYSILMLAIENKRKMLIYHIINNNKNNDFIDYSVKIKNNDGKYEYKDAHSIALEMSKTDKSYIEIANKIAQEMITKRSEHYDKIISKSTQIESTFKNSIEKIENVYNKFKHFLYELIQNADDNDYEDGIDKKLIFTLIKT